MNINFSNTLNSLSTNTKIFLLNANSMLIVYSSNAFSALQPHQQVILLFLSRPEVIVVEHTLQAILFRPSNSQLTQCQIIPNLKQHSYLLSISLTKIIIKNKRLEPALALGSGSIDFDDNQHRHVRGVVLRMKCSKHTNCRVKQISSYEKTRFSKVIYEV